METGKEIAVFLMLLRAGLWRKPIENLDYFPLNQTTWERLYQYGVQQTVEGILFEGVQQLDPSLQPSKSLLLKWLVRTEKIRQRNRWMNTRLVEQAQFYRNCGLDPTLLKGQGLAQSYVDPTLRMSGDIDWYFDQPQAFARANAEVRQFGLPLIEAGKISSNYHWQGCHVDQHAQLFDLHNPFVKSYLKELEEHFDDGSTLLIGKTEINVLSPLLQTIQVNAHILKHLLSFGIGLRQICDAACLYAYYSTALDGQLLKEVYQRLGIIRWVAVLHQLLVDFIGLPEQSLPFHLEKEQDATWMMQDIWTGGNFGFYDTAYVKSKEGQFVGRRLKIIRLWKSFWRYLPYAPLEAISFPIVHYRSGR
ncbi:hypothetical protein BWD42_07260 [Sphingobacterium sp. CZ-UAM]|uniref:nucleotidyltransferase family protein n=1 Tax=Sphingobacterium sp. CZ-UAM TaxID=1933868 RepID=UPI000986B3F0|nr:nucleotidyltransferase family protein [Sphingobacterium sp. CZ-UAM]OOG19696.1 hypothetical protein BWD42_07260 [Sphingobacterium sp. CZ-UAM]